LIGGHAVAVHAEPRLTEDLDVFVEPTLANGRRVRAALVEFGFGAIAPTARNLAEANCVWMLGRKPQRIDLLTGISGVTFARALRGSITIRLDGETRVPVIGRLALIANKKAAGRPKDLIDVASLELHAPPGRRR
jgi:hypothetical protein